MIEIENIKIEMQKLIIALENFEREYEKLYRELDLSKVNVDDYSDFIIMDIAEDYLYKAQKLLSRIDGRVEAEGNLTKNKQGRFEVNGYELSTGSYVEVFTPEEDTDGIYCPEHYYPSHIAFKDDYYIEHLGENVDIEGAKVRVRK